MKKLLLLLLLITHALSVGIDSSLYEGENVARYFQKIEKTINATMTKKLKNKETITLEKSTLAKLKQLYAIKDEIKAFETISLGKGKVKEERYLKALSLLSSLQNEITRLETKEKDIQQKLFDLKNNIEKTLPIDANKSLLNNQLQYAFYKISQEKILKSLALYSQLFTQEFNKFQKALPRITFKEKNSKNIIKYTDKKIDSIKNKNLLLTIDKDSEAQRDTEAQKEIVTKEKSIQNERDSALIKKTKAHVLLALKYLKEKNQKEFLEVTKSIESDFEAFSVEQKENFTTLLELLLLFGDKHFDDASVALASTQVGFNYIKNSAIMIVDKTLFVYEDKAFSIKTIMTFISIIMIGFIIAKLYKNIVDKYRKKNRIKSLSTARLIANSGYYLLIFITFFTALGTIGLDMHTIFVVIGAILLWLALGLQGFISNYAMGILIKIDRSIRIGDHVELSDEIVGCVDDMDFRSITIQTGDQIRIIIPNSRFISGEFINHSLEDNIRRLHLPFSVEKSLTHKEIEQTVLKTLENSNVPHLKTVDKKAQVIVIDINRKIVRYTLLVWIKQQDNHDMPVVKSEFLKVIQKSLANSQNYATIPLKIKEKNYD